MTDNINHPFFRHEGFPQNITCLTCGKYFDDPIHSPPFITGPPSADDLIIEQTGGLMDGLNGPPPESELGQIFFGEPEDAGKEFTYKIDSEMHPIPRSHETNNSRLWIAFAFGVLFSIPLWVCIYLLWRLLNA